MDNDTLTLLEKSATSGVAHPFDVLVLCRTVRQLQEKLHIYEHPEDAQLPDSISGPIRGQLERERGVGPTHYEPKPTTGDETRRQYESRYKAFWQQVEFGLRAVCPEFSEADLRVVRRDPVVASVCASFSHSTDTITNALSWLVASLWTSKNDAINQLLKSAQTTTDNLPTLYPGESNTFIPFENEAAAQEIVDRLKAGEIIRDPRRFDLSVKKLYEACGLSQPVEPLQSGIVAWSRGKRYFFPVSRSEWDATHRLQLASMHQVPWSVYCSASALFDQDGVLWNWFEDASEEIVERWKDCELRAAHREFCRLVLQPDPQPGTQSFPKSDEPTVVEDDYGKGLDEWPWGYTFSGKPVAPGTMTDKGRVPTDDATKEKYRRLRGK